MSDYSKVNLMEVEDSAEKFGFAPDLSTRFVNRPLGVERIGLSRQQLAPNTRAPFGHRHQTHEELYVVVSGGGRIKIDDEVVELGQWDVVRLGPEPARQLEAGPDGLEVLAFGEADSPESGKRDAEMLRDFWTD